MARPPKKKWRIAVDFDGTVVTHEYPDVGSPIPGALIVLRDLVTAGHEIVLWTCRANWELKDAMKYMADAGVEVVFANKDPDPSTGSPKIVFDLCIDDRNLGCPTMASPVQPERQRQVVDWAGVRRLLTERGVL